MFSSKKEKTFQEKCNNFAVAHYQLLDNDKFIDAQYALCNSASHFNAVQAVKSGRADKVLLCWAGSVNGVIHVINVKGGKYFDETWGGASPFTDYRLIREVKSHEYKDIYNILCATKKMFISMFATTRKEKRTFKDSIHGTI